MPTHDGGYVEASITIVTFAGEEEHIRRKDRIDVIGDTTSTVSMALGGLIGSLSAQPAHLVIASIVRGIVECDIRREDISDEMAELCDELAELAQRIENRHEEESKEGLRQAGLDPPAPAV